jgi:hypothetical protein
MASCGSCDTTWDTQSSLAHCSLCHLSFSTVGNFDLHRNKDGTCAAPGTLGLVERTRAGGILVWVKADENDFWNKRKAVSEDDDADAS